MAAGNELTVNLTDVNVARRLRIGIACLALGLGLAILFEKMHAAPLFRLALFVPFFVSANAFFQGVFETCGFSAFAGLRMTGCGSERIADRTELRSVRARGMKQIGLAIVAALALTALFVFAA
jgi:hypothetical protein